MSNENSLYYIMFTQREEDRWKTEAFRFMNQDQVVKVLHNDKEGKKCFSKFTATNAGFETREVFTSNYPFNALRMEEELQNHCINKLNHKFGKRTLFRKPGSGPKSCTNFNRVNRLLITFHKNKSKLEGEGQYTYIVNDDDHDAAAADDDDANAADDDVHMVTLR